MRKPVFLTTACLRLPSFCPYSLIVPLAQSSGGQSVSALLLLLSHSVYYESEDAAAVALAQVRAVLVGLKVADHKVAPSAVDIETQARSLV